MGTPAQVIEQAAVSGYDEGHARKQQRKDMFADEDRQRQANDFLTTRNNALTSLPSLKQLYGEDSQQYKDALQTIAQSQYNVGQLYHPDKAPGALQKDWHFLLEKMHGIAAPKDKTPSSVTTQTPAVTLNPGMVPSAQPSTPLLITQSFEGKPAPGMVTQGNLDLSNRPNIDNGDGTHSSTFSMSFGTDKGEVLVPGVGDGKTYPVRQLRVLYTLPDGSQRWAVPGNQPHNWIAPERPTPQNNEALNQYLKTGKNFGTFEDEKAADAYGKALHEDQEKYGNNGVTAHPVSPSGNVTIPAAAPVTVTKALPVSWGQAQILKKKAAAMQKAQQEAGLLASGNPLSPQEQAMSNFRTQEVLRDAQVDSALKLADRLGITGTALDEFKQQLAGLKTVVPKPLTGAAGVPYKGADGLYYQNVSSPDGTVGRRPMPPDWKPTTKAVRGALVNSKEHGFIQTWVDPMNPSRIVGWQKVTPSRSYRGTTNTKTSTDNFGVTTTSSGTTMPVNTAPISIDLSGTEEFPNDFNGVDNPDTPSSAETPSPTPTSKPPKSVSTTRSGSSAPSETKKSSTPHELRNKIPSSPGASGSSLNVDAEGHIPANAPENAGLIAAANQLLDGMDVSKLPIPQKDKAAVMDLAAKYGWGGQGLFTPKEKLLLKESATYLDKAMNDSSMKVLDSKESRIKIANAIHAAQDNSGVFSKAIAVSFGLNEEENDFVSTYLQLIGTISGLGQLTRGGRMTEATAKRLMNELPNPLLTPNSKAAIDKLKRLRSEIDVATEKGSFDLSSDSKSGGLTLDEFKKKHNIR